MLIAMGMNIFSYWFSDKIALKTAGAVVAKKEEYTDLFNVVENLSITAGIKTPKIYVVNDSSPNAFATGRNEENAAVAVTTGLLNILNKTELEGVIAHELSHIRNRDILIGTIVVVLVGFVSLLSDIFLRVGGSNSKNNFRIIGIVLALLSPIFTQVIQLAISRKREFMADASGVLLTRYPEGLASALKKISHTSQPLKHASHAMAHMYISDPFGGNKKTNFFVKLFMTHPPVEERIQNILGLKTPGGR